MNENTTRDKTILLVDNDDRSLEWGKKALSEYGYQVKSFQKSWDALETFKVHPEKFDLVITDMLMPGLNGEQLAMGLMEIRKNIPIIMCSVFSNTMNEEKAKKIGFHDFLIKPVTMVQIIRSINKVLS